MFTRRPKINNIKPRCGGRGARNKGMSRSRRVKVFASLLGVGGGQIMLTPLPQILLCLEGSWAAWQLVQAVDYFPCGHLAVVYGRMVETI